MIVVDTSVWINFFRGIPTAKVQLLRSLFRRRSLAVGDLILCEVLQGVPNDREAAFVEANLNRFCIVPMLNPDLAVRAAANYRRLRSLGITIRKTVDLIIGTYCIENDHFLLHEDRDFEPMRAQLGLKVIEP